MTVDDTGGGDVLKDSNGTVIIVDGLLCSILRAISRSAVQAELISVIEKEATENEVKTSWHKLFSHFKEAIDPTRKKKIIDIDRESTKKRITDIVTQLTKVERESDIMGIFAMPWNYIIKEFRSESEERCRIWEEEKSKDYDSRIDNLEIKMDKKHNELLAAMQDMVLNLGRNQQQSIASGIAHPTYARVAGGSGVGVELSAGQGHQQILGHMENSGRKQDLLQVPSWGNRSTPGGGRRFTRSKSPSIKRLRHDDGTVTEIEQHQTGQKKKAVTGTSNSAVTGRKMRSPPADIFVWGVHPDTEIDDIIKDLAESDIKVEPKDIEKKSKPEAYLTSYRISVQASDLSKALDPAIWPLRVKVREYIHYARRNRGPQDHQVGKPGPIGHQGAHAQVGHHAQGRGGQPAFVVQPAQVRAASHGGQQSGHLGHAQQEGPGGQGVPHEQLYPNLSNANLWNVLRAPGVPNPNL